MIKGILKGVAKASALCVTPLCVAAEPLVWERRPNRPAPAQFDTFHGETLDFRCTFTGFGALPFVEGADVRLWYQTNGMGAAWWSVPATVASNVVSAAWPPSADPGADRVSFFFGAPSNAYAAAQVRFRNSPGAHPNDLDPPSVLDWQSELASATNALRESIAAELREKADVSRTAVVTNSITVPGRIEGGNWTLGSSFDGLTTGDLGRDAALTASATDGSVYWSAQTDYTIGGDVGIRLYRYAIAWYNPYTEIFQAAVWNDQTNQKPSAVADLEFNSVDLIGDFRSELGLSWPESFATLNTPEPDTVAWQGFRFIPLIGTSTAYVPTQAVETVVYSRELAAATNALRASVLEGSLSTTGGVVRGSVEIDGALTVNDQQINPADLATRQDLEGKADASITNDIGQLKTESTLVYRLFSGSNIVMEVTNDNSRVNPPAMKLMRLNDKGIYKVMWTETNGLERTYNRAVSNTAEQVAALEKKAAETYAPRGWSATTSGLGADAPKDTTWISTPTTVIAGGLEYSKVVTSSGQLWFLRSNGMVTNMGGNSGGYFDISASDGTSVFSIEKTDSYMAPVDIDGISKNGNTVTIRLSVVSADHPFLRYTPTLNAPVVWQKEEDGFSAPIAVSWSGSSGAWVATVTTTAKEGFFQFEFFQEGGTKIKSGGVMDVSTGGILCTDGIHKCRPVYNTNGTVTLEVF